MLLLVSTLPPLGLAAIPLRQGAAGVALLAGALFVGFGLWREGGAHDLSFGRRPEIRRRTPGWEDSIEQVVVSSTVLRKKVGEM